MTELDFDHPPADPLPIMQQWLDEARTINLPNPNAMTLATVDADGKPSARIVLLKSFDARGAVFFTNRLSRKGKALTANPRVTLLFHWDALDRQIRIEGSVSQTTDAESDDYFATRPRASRIGAWASRQSQPAHNRAELERAVQEFEQRFANVDVPRPPHWGGYRVSLESIEFWQGHEFRLHDRIVYTRDSAQHSAWRVQRLYP